MFSRFKNKEYLCEIWPNAIKSLSHWHGVWAIGLGWAYFIWGVFLYWGDIEKIREVMLHGFWFAAWTCSFLLGINIYKALKAK